MRKGSLPAVRLARGALDPPSLVHLFSPPVPPVRVDPFVSLRDRRALWTEDSVHRAKNLAQLATALAHEGSRTRRAGVRRGMAADAELLAAAYAELAEDVAPDAAVPCAELLIRIARGLIAIFGKGPRKVGLDYSVAELRLSGEQRRALALIASELIVNALKYAFPERGGTVALTLSLVPAGAVLSVADDGIGLGLMARPGSGSRILDELAVLLGAPVDRTAVAGGGLCVSVQLPLANPAGAFSGPVS